VKGTECKKMNVPHLHNLHTDRKTIEDLDSQLVVFALIGGIIIIIGFCMGINSFIWSVKGERIEGIVIQRETHQSKGTLKRYTFVIQIDDQGQLTEYHYSSEDDAALSVGEHVPLLKRHGSQYRIETFGTLWKVPLTVLVVGSTFLLISLLILSIGKKRPVAETQPPPLSLLELKEELKQPHETRRIQAVQALQHRNALAAIHILLQTCDDPHERIRYEAIKGLHQHIGRPVRKGTELLPLFRADPSVKHRMLHAFIMACGDEYGSIRKEAAIALGKMDDICVIPPLIRALDDPYVQVRDKATAALEQLCFRVQRIAFQGKTAVAHTGKQTLFNPDVTNLRVPFINLKVIAIKTASYNFHQIERFLTYAVNALNQKRLKNQVDVHLYGDPDQLHPNLYNNLTNLCRCVHVYHEEEFDISVCS
jgi:hypothetical protein